ncbi:Putrescine-binding periplasmic protein [Senna tora]|uniref:Putrescine-binding periplasmic protein n=1 Tax=Senna tora TaxID=362788 RepID=A0A834SU34_9FABA|nr:Putrescine-binding periplasmic protein [Senna tora]
MAAFTRTWCPLSVDSPLCRYHFRNPKPSFLLIPCSSKTLVRFSSTIRFSGNRNVVPRSPAATAGVEHQAYSGKPLVLAQNFVRLAVSVVLFLGFGFCFRVRVCSASSFTLTATSSSLQEKQTTQDDEDVRKQDNDEEDVLDKDLEAAFNAWKSKTFALTVPLRIVALRSSVPPSWIKDFMRSQGRRLKFNVKYNVSLESIFSDLSIPFTKGNLGPASALAADVVTIGDSWLKFAIDKGIIEPIRDVEDQDWFKGLDEKWKVYLRRNTDGEIDPKGDIWAAPYRWGCLVIAYNKSKFQKHNLAPIEDWADLWRPELAGRISMVDSPREVVGTVLKYMGASYNTNNINLQVDGGRDAVQHNLALLGKQVRLFDSVHYLKAFGVGVGDVWVAVGWSSDVIPFAKRMSNEVIPEKGESLDVKIDCLPCKKDLSKEKRIIEVRSKYAVNHLSILFVVSLHRIIEVNQRAIRRKSVFAIKSVLKITNHQIRSGARISHRFIVHAKPLCILAKVLFGPQLKIQSLSVQWYCITELQYIPPIMYITVPLNIYSGLRIKSQMTSHKA